MTAALGVRSHSGWAAYCILAGDPTEPDLLARGRMALNDPSIAGSKQPFHTAEPMDFAAARTFIARCRRATERLARAAVEALARERPLGACCVLTSAGRELPDLKAILASHALIHAAEGAFYRDAVAGACAALGIAVRRVRERDLESECGVLPTSGDAVRTRLRAMGDAAGPPWTADEKMSARAAWLMLAALPAGRLRR